MTIPDSDKPQPTSVPGATPPPRRRLLPWLLLGLVAFPMMAACFAYGFYVAGERASQITVSTVTTNTGDGVRINLDDAARRADTDRTIDQTGQAMGQALTLSMQAMLHAQQAAADRAASAVTATSGNGTTINDDGDDDTGPVVQSSQGSNTMNIFGRGQNVSIVNGVVTINGVVQNGSNSTQGKGPVVDSLRPVAVFSGVTSSLAADITFVHGDTPSVTVKAQENLLQHIQTDVKNGTLRLQTNGSISTQHTIQIVVTSPTPPNKLEFSGVGKVDLGELRGDLDLDVSGSVNVQGHGALNDAKVELSGVGAITLSGTANKVKLDLSGTGRASLGALQAKTVKLDVSGVGNATVFASESVRGDLSGVGSVTVRGNPARRDIDRSGLGKVHYEI